MIDSALGGATLVIALWLGYKSPQALQAKIEKERYLRSEREKHYKHLNEDIFLPLSNGIVIISNGLSNEKERLSLNISSTINDPDMQKALDHLNIDYPGFTNDFRNLQAEVNGYSQNLDMFFKKIDEMIIDKFQPFMGVIDEYPFSQDFDEINIHCTSDVILAIFSQLPRGMVPYNKEQIQEFYHRVVSNYSKTDATPHDIAQYRLLGRYIANLSASFRLSAQEPHQDTIDIQRKIKLTKTSIYKRICEIVSDEDLFNRYGVLMSKRANIMKKDSEFKEKIHGISQKIGKGHYTNKASCCEDKVFLKK